MPGSSRRRGRLLDTPPTTRIWPRRGHTPVVRVSGARASDIADRDWLTVFQLPRYAPDLNSAENLIRTTAHQPGEPCLSPTPTT